MEQVSYFQYTGCVVTYEYDRSLVNNISSYQALCGVATRKDIYKINLDWRHNSAYNTLAIHFELLGVEILNSRTRNLQKN